MVSDVILAGDLNIYRTDTVDGRMISYVINHIVNKDISKVAQGKSVVHIKADELSKIHIRYPDKSEQDKIITFLGVLSNRISKQRELVEKLKTYKRGALSVMFPQKGESVPKCRFASFSRNWEKRKLGEIIEDYIERTTVEDQYPVLTTSQHRGIVLQENYFSGERVSQNGNIGYFVIPRGYFAYRSRSDNDVFVFNRNDAVDVGIISYFYPVFKPNGVDSNFLVRRLNYGLKEQIKTNSEGTGQHVLSLKKFKNIVGLFPSLEEQKAIGDFFESIDHLISLHQNKLDMLMKTKQSLLQQLFI